MDKVCLVIGAGVGIGGTVGARFAAGGYHAVLCRRSDAEGLNRLVSDIEAAAGKAAGRLLNVVEPESIESLIAEVEQDVGPIHAPATWHGRRRPLRVRGHPACSADLA